MPALRHASAVALVLLSVLPAPARALTAEDMIGTYEDDEGRNTCDANPALLSVRRSPDHVAFSWPVPFAVFDGTVRDRVIYDLLDERGDALVLRLEGETRLGADGATVIWILRPTPEGFCWGRKDWPLVRCEHPYRRCGGSPPLS